MSEVMKACGIFIVYAVAAVFAQNAVFSRALGVSRLVKLVDDPAVDTFVFGGLLCLVQLLAAPLAYFANIWIRPLKYRAAIRPLVFVLCSMAAFLIVLLLILAIFRKQSARAKNIIAVLPMAALPAGGFILVGVLCAIWRSAVNAYKKHVNMEAKRGV